MIKNADILSRFMKCKFGPFESTLLFNLITIVRLTSRAIAVGEQKHSGEFVPPYHFSDY